MSWTSLRRRIRWPWLLAALGALLALALGAWLLLWLIGVVDSDRPARELALRQARAAAEMDYGRLWEGYSPCFQRHHPRAVFLAEQRRHTEIEQLRAPGDTRYSVVAVRADGAYRRVEVRVEAPGFQLLDYEVDLRRYEGRWVTVDSGGLGHRITDDCVLEGRP